MECNVLHGQQRTFPLSYPDKIDVYVKNNYPVGLCTKNISKTLKHPVYQFNPIKVQLKQTSIIMETKFTLEWQYRCLQYNTDGERCQKGANSLIEFCEHLHRDHGIPYTHEQYNTPRDQCCDNLHASKLIGIYHLLGHIMEYETKEPLLPDEQWDNEFCSSSHWRGFEVFYLEKL